LELLLLIGFISLLALNTHASRLSLRDELVSPSQRKAQLLLIWLLPVLGALLVMAVTNHAPARSKGSYPPEPDVGDQLVTGLGRLNERGYIRSPDDHFHSGGGSDAAPD
jgi:hypothetical protein